MRRDDERLADIIEAAEKIAVRAAKGRAAFAPLAKPDKWMALQ